MSVDATEKAIILGAGGTGRELASWLPSIGFSSILFLDDKIKSKDVIGPLSSWISFDDAVLFCALGSAHKMKFRGRILSSIPSQRFKSAISHLSFCACRSVGLGSLVFPFSVISSTALLEEFVLVYHGAIVSHDCLVRRNVVVSNGAVLSGGVEVEEGSYIGANAVINEGVKVGKNCIIASGAAVISDVKDNRIYYAPGKFKER